MQYLVIVESPKKAELIQGFLKRQKLTNYKVMASAGHIRDLAEKKLSVDVERGFIPEYEVSADKRSIVSALKAEVKKSDMVYLASDEDREGEAIAWHLAETLQLPEEKRKRIVFHEITSEAFLHALEHPRDIDQSLVDAQQARRVLDRIVGFELSPVLWQRIHKSNLSAGRVQSVAVRLIVDREREISAFVPTSSYRVQADMRLDEQTSIRTELNHRPSSEAEATKLLQLCVSSPFRIADISKKDGKRSPSAPFTTSTLQQEAASRLGYSVTQIMRLAQSLYENGHITYMRTDSVNLSAMAMRTIEQEIKAKWGEANYQRRQYSTKSKGAQEAHEAIRPTYIDRETISGTKQEQKLYELIRRRTLASQMADAKIERTTITIPIQGSKHSFVAQGEVIVSRGFLLLYMDEEQANSGLLPAVQVGQELVPESIQATERFSQRPARYTEASMVHKMEELGIGRPSTYAPTLQTIQRREYVQQGDREGTERTYIQLSLEGSTVARKELTEVYGADKGKLIPTDVGTIVNDFLVEHFPRIVDYDFTAKVEQEFDHIADGDLQWQEVLSRFYADFHPTIIEAKTIKEGSAKVGSRELGIDPKSGRKVFASLGRYGAMIQIGTSEDEEKPSFASLQPNQSIYTISLEEALELFSLPKQLGEYEGSKVSVAVGRFGPYVRHGSQFISIPKGTDPLSVDYDEAVRLILEKRDAEIKSLIKDYGHTPELQVRQGRFGPYIKYDGANYKIPKGTDATTLTLEDCLGIVGQETNKSKSTKRSTTTRTTKSSAGKSEEKSKSKTATKAKATTSRKVSAKSE